ncbi:hypothetical protein LTR94_017044 [Friedmanniomyces endolithicus]|nr:hypothetical protein LTR94_017044 [Friedmanniomyces endolithicus]
MQDGGGVDPILREAGDAETAADRQAAPLPAHRRGDRLPDAGHAPMQGVDIGFRVMEQRKFVAAQTCDADRIGHQGAQPTTQ